MQIKPNLFKHLLIALRCTNIEQTLVKELIGINYSMTFTEGSILLGKRATEALRAPLKTTEYILIVKRHEVFDFKVGCVDVFICV